MSFGTGFPEMVIGFAETVTQTVEAGEEKEWSAEDFRQVTAACREVREKFAAMDGMLRNALTQGVDPALFVRREEPRLARLDKLLSRHSAILAEADRLLTASPEMRALIAEYEALLKSMSQHRGLLNEALSKMKAPRRPIDWQKVQEAQAAFGRGETVPFQRTPEPTGT